MCLLTHRQQCALADQSDCCRRAYKGLIPRAASQLGQPSVLATVSEVERALDFERSEGHTNMQVQGCPAISV